MYLQDSGSCTQSKLIVKSIIDNSILTSIKYIKRYNLAQ